MQKELNDYTTVLISLFLVSPIHAFVLPIHCKLSVDKINRKETMARNYINPNFDNSFELF